MKDLHPLVKILVLFTFASVVLNYSCGGQSGPEQCRRVCAPNGVASYRDMTGTCTCQSADPATKP